MLNWLYRFFKFTGGILSEESNNLESVTTENKESDKKSWLSLLSLYVRFFIIIGAVVFVVYSIVPVFEINDVELDKDSAGEVETEPFYKENSFFYTTSNYMLYSSSPPPFVKGAREDYRMADKRKLVWLGKCQFAKGGRVVINKVEDDRIYFTYYHNELPHPTDGYCFSGMYYDVSVNEFPDLLNIHSRGN